MTPEELRRKAAEIRKQAEERFKAAEKVAEKEKYEAEFRAVDELLKQADALEAQAKQAEAEEESRNKEAERLRSQFKAHQPPADQPPGGGSGRIDPGEQEDDKTRSLNDWLVQVAKAADNNVGHEARERLERAYGSEYRAWDSAPKGSERRALSISSGIAGGYLMPASYRAEIMSLAAETAIVRPRATVIPMDGLEFDWPILDQTTAPTAGSTSFFGGVVADWTADDAEKPESEPRFRLDKLKAHELAGYTEVPRTLLQHSAVSLDPLIRNLFGGAIAWFEDFAFLRGNGTGKPIGVTQCPALLLTGTARGSASVLTFANMIACWTKMYQQGRSSAVWVISHAAESAFLQMTGTANTVFIPTGYYVTGTNGSGAAQQPLNYALLGRPVLVSEKLPALNSPGDVGLYDFSRYIVGDPGMLEVATSEHYKFRNNKIAYRFIHHVAGLPWINGPITLQDGTTQVSPFVQLQIHS